MTAVASRNVTFVSHSDQAGRSDGVQIMVHRGYAYIGHTFSNGITIMDVRDPKRPRVVDFIACPPNTRSIHLQTHDDLLLATNMPSVWTMQEFQNQQDYFAASPADKLAQRSGASPPVSACSISRGPGSRPGTGSWRSAALSPIASGSRAGGKPTRPSPFPSSP